MREEKTVNENDLNITQEIQNVPKITCESLMAQLECQVVGQRPALEKVIFRVVLTRAKLDLRPIRPDGVFLFVGPTGVGKTASAKALSASVFGDENALIRLDMSEYAQEWAISRLIGPQPGYVGYTESEDWLTTKICEKPQAIILLDEIEKAHPRVWNTFLQVFDAGRLTDARGKTASFSDCIVIMTSNLGHEAFQKNPMGFASGGDLSGDRSVRAIDAIKNEMPPELVNRLDEIVVFQPLGQQAIQEIAAIEANRAIKQVKTRGYQLAISTDAIEHIAKTGYDPAYGARHLHRNIERLLLQPLAELPPSQYRVDLHEDQLVITEINEP